jgi:glycosyltransferase 2 family protein
MKSLKNALTWIGTPIALILLIQQIYSYRHEIGNIHYQVRYWSLSVSGLLLMVHFVALALAWHRSLRLMGAEANYQTSLRVHFSSYLLKYIPGQLWAPLRMSVMQQENGVAVEKSLAGYGLIQVSTVLAPFIVISIFGWNISWLAQAHWGKILIFASMGLSIATYLVFLGLPQLLSKIKRFSFLRGSSDVFLDTNLVVLFIYAIASFWFYFFFYSFCDLPLHQLLALVAAGAVADITCYPLPFIPSGLGIRELSLSRVLPFVLGLGRAQCLTLSVLHRLFVTIIEMITIGLVLLFIRSKKTVPSSSDAVAVSSLLMQETGGRAL